MTGDEKRETKHIKSKRNFLKVSGTYCTLYSLWKWKRLRIAYQRVYEFSTRSHQIKKYKNK